MLPLKSGNRLVHFTIYNNQKTQNLVLDIIGRVNNNT